MTLLCSSEATLLEKEMYLVTVNVTLYLDFNIFVIENSDSLK
jgi:hypothetical protein